MPYSDIRSAPVPQTICRAKRQIVHRHKHTMNRLTVGQFAFPRLLYVISTTFSHVSSCLQYRCARLNCAAVVCCCFAHMRGPTLQVLTEGLDNNSKV